MNQKEIFNNIMSRTSVRSFLDQPVESEKVEMLLHAAMAAPSACNKQPWLCCDRRQEVTRSDSSFQSICQHGKGSSACHCCLWRLKQNP